MDRVTKQEIEEMIERKIKEKELHLKRLRLLYDHKRSHIGLFVTIVAATIVFMNTEFIPDSTVKIFFFCLSVLIFLAAGGGWGNYRLPYSPILRFRRILGRQNWFWPRKI